MAANNSEKNTPRTSSTQQPQWLEIKAVTWTKDSHGLFDYESKSCTHEKVRIKPSPLTIFRNKNTLNISVCGTDQERQKISPDEHSLLAEILPSKEREDPRYYIKTAQEEISSPINNENDANMSQEAAPAVAPTTPENVYLIVRSLKHPDGSNRGHAIEIGETIKLGRVEYVVIEMKTNSKVQVCEGNEKSFFKNDSKFDGIDIEAGSDATCKVCLEECGGEENFLLAPCRCTGSCQFIHLNCLRRWIESKVKKEVTGGTAYYNFKKFECEICKYELPKFINKNGCHQLLRIPRPEGNYMILEEMGDKTKDIVVIQNIPADGIKLGRGHGCEIRVTDISVSRQHAMIRLINDRFVLFDNNSKFGTLVKPKKNIPIDSEKRACQIGRTVLTFVIKKDRFQDPAAPSIANPTAILAQNSLKTEKTGGSEKALGRPSKNK